MYKKDDLRYDTKKKRKQHKKIEKTNKKKKGNIDANTNAFKKKRKK